MGGDAMYRAILRTRTRGADRHVLLALCSFADVDGWCYPSIRQLARRAGVNPSSVQAALPRLEKLGELELHKRGHAERDPVKDRDRRTGGFQATHYYRLVFVSGVRAIHTPQKQAGVRTIRTEVYGSTSAASSVPKQVSTTGQPAVAGARQAWKSLIEEMAYEVLKAEGFTSEATARQALENNLRANDWGWKAEDLDQALADVIRRVGQSDAMGRRARAVKGSRR